MREIKEVCAEFQQMLLERGAVELDIRQSVILIAWLKSVNEFSEQQAKALSTAQREIVQLRALVSNVRPQPDRNSKPEDEDSHR